LSPRPIMPRGRRTSSGPTSTTSWPASASSA
jgi:hypothetical protein